ncbi:MAG: hypothetical protein SCALA702_05750 [Melioribacteraceae bacterium]|nr:MAG: hypothetical protein SCALA702_05750 [Melioribacteraceae bacterium]
MKKLVLFIVIFLVATSLNAQVLGPKLSVPNDDFDFGDVNEGEKVKHDFTLLNSGDDVLVIERVTASCGCTAAKPAVDSLKPGESTSLEVVFNTSRRSGLQKKYVYIKTNDKEQENYRISFSANILKRETTEKIKKPAPKLRLSTNQYNFGKVTEGEKVKAKIDFSNIGTAILAITDVKSSCGCAATLLKKNKLNPGEQGSLIIEFDSADRSGKLTRTVTLYSNDPVQPVQPITLYINIAKKDS